MFITGARYGRGSLGDWEVRTQGGETTGRNENGFWGRKREVE